MKEAKAATSSVDTRTYQFHPARVNRQERPPNIQTIIFPPVYPTRLLQPHRGALILSLGIGDFDVRRILVDPGVDPLFCPTSTCSITCPFDTLR